MQFAVTKLLQGLVMVLVVSAVTFALLTTAGGDAFSSLRDNPQVSAETIERLRRVYGLDRPVTVRYAKWLSDAARGDLGESFQFRTPVRELVWPRFLSTLYVSAAALFIALAAALSLALIATRHPGRWLNAAVEISILLTASTPRLVLALVALATVASVSGTATFWTAAAVLGTPLFALFLAQAHDGLRAAMKEEFVLMARAKGLSEAAVIRRHALRAALNPVLTIFGLSIGGLLGGSVIVEAILGRSGLGSLMVTAVRSRDVPLIMGIVVVASCAVWAGNTLAEFLQVRNDKRLRETN